MLFIRTVPYGRMYGVSCRDQTVCSVVNISCSNIVDIIWVGYVIGIRIKSESVIGSVIFQVLKLLLLLRTREKEGEHIFDSFGSLFPEPDARTY